ncbi:MAG: TolC family protein [Thermodesulfobacteriota bacterium]
MRPIPLLLLIFFGLSLANAQAVPPADRGLTAALRATMAHHPAVQGKAAELAAQGYNIDTARAARYPGLSGDISTQDNGEQYGALRLRQPLWAFGRIDTGIDREKARLRAEEQALLQVRRQLIEQTAAAYARILGVRRRLLVADENIGEHQKLYERIKRRQAGQLAAEADVRLAFSRLTQAQLQQARLAGELQVALAELRALTQVTIASNEQVVPELARLPEPGAITALAQENQADILYKKELIRVAEYNEKQERIASTPTLYAEAQRDFFDAPATNGTRVGLILTGSLDGAGLGVVGRTRAAAAQVNAARQDLVATRTTVELRVRSLLINLAVQERLQEGQHVSVAAVGQTRLSFLRQYDIGRKSWLEVLNIQREFTEQRLLLARAASERLTLSLRLAALAGRLDGPAGLKRGVEEVRPVAQGEDK